MAGCPRAMPWVSPSHRSESAAPTWNANVSIALDSYFPIFHLFILFIHCPYTHFFFFFSSIIPLMWSQTASLPSWNSLEGLLGFRVKGYVGHEPFTSSVWYLLLSPIVGVCMRPDNTAVPPQHLHCNVLYFANCSGPSNMQPNYTLFPWLQTTDLLRKHVWGVKLQIKNVICTLVNFF